MPPETITLIVSVAVAAGALLTNAYFIGVKIGSLETKKDADLARLSHAALAVKVDTMWAFTLRRAEAEAIHRGVGVKRSPLVISAESRSWMNHLADELRDFYQRIGKALSTNELLLAIESEFGERIVRDVCIPKGLLAGACLLIAAAVAKGDDCIPLTPVVLVATAV